MSIIRIVFSAFLLLIAVSSCTTVTAVNVPGTKQQKFPKKLVGKYTIQFPEALAVFEGQVSGVQFTSNSMIIQTLEEETESKLGDSLYYSMIGKDMYLTMGSPGNYTVLKVVMKKKVVELYSMYSSGELTTDQLLPYFKSAKAIVEEDSEEGTGMTSYEVEIDDAKLGDYFKSSIPMADPILLNKK